MEFAYFDESGDLGAKGSKKIVMCLVCTRKRKKLNKIIRRTKQRLLRKKKTGDWLNRRGGEVKFYSFPDENILIKTLKEISKVDIKIYYICFDKQGKVFNKTSKELIIGTLFWHILKKDDKEEVPTVISDLDFFGDLQSYFSLEDYEKEKIKKLSKENEIKFKKVNYEDYKLNKKIRNKLIIKVEPINSHLNDELQAVDLICGSIFQFLENNNPVYYNIIKNKVIRGMEFKK